MPDLAKRAFVPLAATFALAACHSPGPYGHSRIYVPLGAEEDAAASAALYDPAAARELPGRWKGKAISVFGVVKARSEGKGGANYVTLSVRSLAPKNACATSDEDSCRVTVSDREHALLHAHVKLGGEDEIGKHSVVAGSLLRVIGVLSDEVDPNDGAPVVRARYYRHWPPHFYRTTGDPEAGP